MKPLDDKRIYSFVNGQNIIFPTTSADVRAGSATEVTSYLDLVKKIAELQFRNPAYVLLFRGQCQDHQSDGVTSLLPTLFRNSNMHSNMGLDASIARKFRRLLEAEKLLLEDYPTRSSEDELLFVQRLRIVRWAIIQHYHINQTPLLDLTHSPRIAASFACVRKTDYAQHEAFLFVIAVPQISGAITVDVESGIQLVRLSAVCPPSAVRPHLQEGYLIGEYPELNQYEQKQLYRIEEVDFGRRLLAKFIFNPQNFWSDVENFPRIGSKALMDVPDPFKKRAAEIKMKARQLVPPQ